MRRPARGARTGNMWHLHGSSGCATCEAITSCWSPGQGLFLRRAIWRLIEATERTCASEGRRRVIGRARGEPGGGRSRAGVAHEVAGGRRAEKQGGRAPGGEGEGGRRRDRRQGSGVAPGVAARRVAAHVGDVDVVGELGRAADADRRAARLARLESGADGLASVGYGGAVLWGAQRRGSERGGRAARTAALARAGGSARRTGRRGRCHCACGTRSRRSSPSTWTRHSTCPRASRLPRLPRRPRRRPATRV